MVNTLTVLKSIHVVGAVLWIGGGFILNVIVTMAFRSRDAAKQLFAVSTAAFIGQRIFTPLSLIVIGTGIWLTAKYFDFGEYWISYALAAFIVSFSTGFFYLGPRSGAIAAELEAGADQERIGAISRTWTIVARLDLLLLLSIVVMMVIRPD
jgi:uncharacterized membrane protein